MKKYIITLSVLSFGWVSAQHTHGRHCGTTHKQTQLETKFPEIKTAREQLDAKILARKISGKKLGKLSNVKASNYNGEVYEIPVVVHIIESNASKNANLKLTDDQIKTWIDNANKMYAGTYGGDYYDTGDGIGKSSVIPFKLTLAKRDPNCNPTTGIIRYDGSTLPKYDDYGVNSDYNNGVSEEEIVKFAPHWSENGYYNIYVVTTFDGDATTYGLMGYAYYPQNSNDYYHTFMKVAVVTNEDDSTLAHEFGHSLGLDHPFGNEPDNIGEGGICPPVTAGKTDDEACLIDNDKICDTERIQSLLSVYPTPSNYVTNPCTNQNYQDTQYNIMNYTYSTRKFTAGQRERALEVFMENRKNLTTSLGATEPEGEAVNLTQMDCAVALTNAGRYSIGPKSVVLGSINNQSSTHSNEEFYTDYSKYCFAGNVKTDLKENETHTLSIGLDIRNPQKVKAWIDYNNDGQFTDDELIANSNDYIQKSDFSATFNVPSTAVKNTYLRMRVIADLSDFGACGTIKYGQIEDYAVRIIPENLVTPEINATREILAYDKANNRLILNGKDNIGDFQIYDTSGRLIQNGSTTTNEITLNGISAGAYILKYQNKSVKFIKN